jgi:flagellar hook-length control protein FliK
MDWWHVALDIRPSSAETSSTRTESSSSKTPNSEIFSIGLAASKTRSLKTAGSSASKNSSAVGKQSSTAKAAGSTGKSGSATAANDPSTHASSAASTDKSAAAGKSGTAKSAKASSSANPSDGAGPENHSAAPDAAAAANSTANNPSANAVAKGRASARGATVKANGAGTADPGTPGNTITDPSADASNASGLSLLQLLAQSREGADSAAPSTQTGTTASTDKAADGSDTANNDANALALAMFAQSFAAALGTAPAAAQGAISNVSPTASDGATEGVTDATRSSGGSMQELVSLLARDIAAGAQGKSDASQSDVATTLGSPGDTSTANTRAATEGLNSLASSLAPSLAHLGAASHFSLHPQTDTNTAQLKSSVGSAAWTDELGGQLTWMTQHGLESGSLRVSPEHLGPVEVKISVQNGDASVWFGASHPDTRAALEQALPRLREMFANQGLTLTDSGVSRESPRQTRSSAPQSVAAVSAVGSSDVSVSAAVRLSLGLVDTYA